jgi:hypothetical protein
MKRAKKMVVITEDEYQRLKSKQAVKMKREAQKYTQRISKTIQGKFGALSSLSTQPSVSTETTSIEDYFTPDFRGKVKNILLDLKQSGMKINNNREIILPHGDTVSGTDIVSLLKEILVGARLSKQKPSGWRKFLEIVASSDIPIETFSKTAVKGIIQRLRRDEMTWEEY